MLRNSQVVDSWLSGEAASNANMRTDGVDLYSYQLRIGYRNDRRAVVFDYTASGVYYSQTTSKHVGLAARQPGVRLVQPE